MEASGDSGLAGSKSQLGLAQGVKVPIYNYIKWFLSPERYTIATTTTTTAHN